MKIFEKYGKWAAALIFVIIVIAVYKMFDNLYRITGVLSTFFKVLSPFVIGFVIAYILNIPCKKINSICKKSKNKFISSKSRMLSILAVYFVAVLIVFIVIRSVVPALYKNILDLYYNIPIYFEDVISTLVEWQHKHELVLFEVDEINITKAFNNLLGKIDVTELSKYAKGVVNITSGVINVFIGLIISVYFLIDKEKIIISVKRLLKIFFKEEKSRKLCDTIAKINSIFSKYIFCQLIDALVVAIASTLVLSILRVRYALILGGMMGAMNLIPYFGAIIASIVSVVITLITGGIFKAIWTAISLLLLQQVDGNFIGPKIMGEVLDISPLWIIFAVTVGGGFFGIVGMIISVPILVAIKMIVTDYIDEKEKKINE